MAEKELQVRIRQKHATTAEWNSSTLVLKEGEIGIEVTADGIKRMKIGDGSSTWANLPYSDNRIENILDGGSNGSLRAKNAASNYAMGQNAVAFGNNAKATGNNSFAVGNGANASNINAVAIGPNSAAAGSGSVALGPGTETSSEVGAQVALGQYNAVTNTDRFVVGDGSGSGSGLAARSNIFSVGKTTEGDYAKLRDKKLATEEYVDNNSGKIDKIKVNGVEQSITNKEVDITVPISSVDGQTGAVTTNAVRHTAQNLTDQQKAQARTNIGAGTSNFSGNYDDLSNKPTIPTVPTDILKYSAQTLTNDQKVQARANIGAGTSSFSGNYADLSGKPDIPVVPTDIVKYSAQTLNDTQKSQARANIGAGTSNFSGNYNDLTNKPTIPSLTGYATETFVTNKINGLDYTYSGDGNYVTNVSQTDGKITVTKGTLPTQTNYAVTVTETAGGASDTYSKRYTIAQSATNLSKTIDIPKDMVVSSGIVETKTTSGAWGLAGTYLVLTLANATSDKVYINVNSLGGTSVQIKRWEVGD